MLRSVAKNMFASKDYDHSSIGVRAFAKEIFIHGGLGLVLGAIVNRSGHALTVFILNHASINGAGDDLVVNANSRSGGGGGGGGSTKDVNDSQRRSAVIRGMILFGLGIAQLALSMLLLFTMMNVFPEYIYGRWQETVPGLAFPALFFGIQTQMFTNINTVLNGGV